MRREWKIELIQSFNPYWRDLSYMKISIKVKSLDPGFRRGDFYAGYPQETQ